MSILSRQNIKYKYENFKKLGRDFRTRIEPVNNKMKFYKQQIFSRSSRIKSLYLNHLLGASSREGHDIEFNLFFL